MPLPSRFSPVVLWLACLVAFTASVALLAPQLPPQVAPRTPEDPR